MDPDDIVDPLIAQRAELDQALAGLGEAARAAKSAFDAYLTEGFTEGQALYLTACLLNGGPKEQG